MKATMLTTSGNVIEGTIVTKQDIDFRDELIRELAKWFPYTGNSTRMEAATALVCRWEMKPRSQPIEQPYDGPQETSPKPEA